ncbi:hypothetical protein COLU111180_18565 [Cohnella lubricantis]|nr:hypothetical protein [Cohnella lubricantis]
MIGILVVRMFTMTLANSALFFKICDVYRYEEHRESFGRVLIGLMAATVMTEFLSMIDFLTSLTKMTT